MPYINSNDLVTDILFRAGEVPGASDWNARAIDYLNRNYFLLCAGASEYLPENVEDWWWMRASGILTLLPIYDAGTVAVTTGDANITLSVAPTISLQGYRFRVDNWTEEYVILSHTAFTTTAVLDSTYNGDTSAATTYEAYKTTYQLDAAVSAIMSPIISFREGVQISGMQPERMDEIWPVSRLRGGVPRAFALENEQQIRFSHGGLTENRSMRMEYRYRPVVAPLTNDVGSIPLVPIQYRPLLSEMALVQLYSDKNDDRINVAASAAKAGLAAMVKENKRRLTKMDKLSGAILPRQGFHSWDHILRTESGLIIG